MSEKSALNANLALLAAGGNLPSSAGPPEATLRAAFARLRQIPEMEIISIARFWITPAFPAGSGPNYVNGAAVVKTVLQPDDVLQCLHAIEAEFGRTRHGARWQSRGLDLDLIGYGDFVLPDQSVHDMWRDLPPQRQAEIAPEQLILPHPRMAERGFVLAPLSDIAPNWRHPRTGRSVAEMLAALPPGAMADIRPLTT